MSFDPIKISELEELQSAIDLELRFMKDANDRAESKEDDFSNPNYGFMKGIIQKDITRYKHQADIHRRTARILADRLSRKSKELIAN